jgi:hypothetical protein
VTAGRFEQRISDKTGSRIALLEHFKSRPYSRNTDPRTGRHCNLGTFDR